MNFKLILRVLHWNSYRGVEWSNCSKHRLIQLIVSDKKELIWVPGSTYKSRSNYNIPTYFAASLNLLDVSAEHKRDWTTLHTGGRLSEQLLKDKWAEICAQFGVDIPEKYIKPLVVREMPATLVLEKEVKQTPSTTQVPNKPSFMDGRIPTHVSNDS